MMPGGDVIVKSAGKRVVVQFDPGAVTKNLGRSVGLTASVRQEPERPFDFTDHLKKFGDDTFSSEGLTLAEGYAKGRLHVCFLFASAQRPSECSVQRERLGHQNIGFHELKDSRSAQVDVGKNASEVIGGQRGVAVDRQDQFVFVGDVERMNAVEKVVPARVRLEAVDRVYDLFSSDLYLSLLQGGHHGVRVFAKRELDGFGTFGFFAYHLNDSNIQGATHVVDRVANDQSEFFWDGFICFDANGALCGLRVRLDHELERAASQIVVDFPAQVIDVMLGPLNLQRGGI